MTPEQIEKVREQFEEQRCPPLIKMRQMDGLYASHDARIAWANYLAGREAQLREDAAEMDCLRGQIVAEQSFALNYRDSRDKARDARDIMQTRAIEAEATIAQLQAQLAAVKGVEPVAWAVWMPDEKCARQLYNIEEAAIAAKLRWQESYGEAKIIPLYAQPPAVQVPDEDAKALQARIKELEDFVISADRIARSVDNLLHRGGYNEDSSARHQLAMIFQPSPQGVPDELPQDPFDHARTYDYAQGWNACRAAMIEGEKK